MNPLPQSYDRQDKDYLEDLIGHQVVDRNETKVGTVENIWQDNAGEPAFLTVKTGWFGLGKTLIVPAFSAYLRPADQRIRVPYTEQVLKDAPTFDSEESLDLDAERLIYNYYALHGMTLPASYEALPATVDPQQPVGQLPPPLPEQNIPNAAPRTGLDDNSLVLHREKLVVGKRDVNDGGLRLRKIVRVETASSSVELMHEEPVVDRVPVNRIAPSSNRVFEEEEIYIPLRREEAVIAKETVVTEEIHAGKETFVEKKDVTETVRAEDLEIVDERKEKSK